MVKTIADHQPHLLIRADGNAEIGIGHLIRCLALAQAWRDIPGRVTFIAAKCPEFFQDKLQEEGIGFEKLACQPGDAVDITETMSLIRRKTPDLVALDGYYFGIQFQREITSAGYKLLFLDDFGHCDKYLADYILNPNPLASQALYPDCPDSTQFLFGLDYALLRREFRKSGKHQDLSRDARRRVKVLITLGGGDYMTMFIEILEALTQLDSIDLEITVVAGGSPENYQQLCSHFKTLSIEIKTLHNVYNIHDVMKETEIAITAAGGTALELACLGVPAVLIVVADNQQMNAMALQQSGAAINLGKYSALTPVMVRKELSRLIADQAAYSEMQDNGRAIIDGRGANRVTAKILEESYGLTEIFSDE